jgi:aminobenzoyl-glutamate utilization protein B
MDNRSDIWLGVDAIKPRFVALSDRVWAMPEVCYTEARSAAEHLAELRHQGFRITENVADIPTALMGEWGEGGPVIAFLGEYDALPGLSQEAGVAEPARWRREATATVAATTCWVRPHCSPPPP